MLQRITLLSMLLSCACATIPGPAMPLEGVVREPVGTISVRGYFAGANGGTAFTDGYAMAGGARVVRQVSEAWAVGSEVAGGGALGKWSSRYGAFARLHARFFFEKYWAVTAGAGGAVGSAPSSEEPHAARTWSSFATGDVGLHAALPFAQRWKWYAGGTVQTTVPTRRPQDFTIYFTPSLGVNFLATEQWRIGLDASAPIVVFYRDVGATQPNFLLGSIPARTEPSWLIGTLSLAYVFGA
jgi:hypothetical protein